MKSFLMMAFFLSASLSAQQGPSELPESLEGLKAMRLDLTSEFSALQRELRTAKTQSENEKIQIKLRDFSRRAKLFRGAAQTSSYSYGSYATNVIAAHGVVGAILKRHSLSKVSEVTETRLLKALVELKELQVPENTSFGDKEINQLQRLLDKSYEVINLELKSK